MKFNDDLKCVGCDSCRLVIKLTIYMLFRHKSTNLKSRKIVLNLTLSKNYFFMQVTTMDDRNIIKPTCSDNFFFLSNIVNYDEQSFKNGYSSKHMKNGGRGV